MKDLAVSAFLLLAVLVSALAVLGACRAPGAFARLHYVGLITLVPPLCVAVAICLRADSFQTVAKGLLLAAALLVTSPVVTHATARALFLRSQGPGPKRSECRNQEG